MAARGACFVRTCTYRCQLPPAIYYVSIYLPTCTAGMRLEGLLLQSFGGTGQSDTWPAAHQDNSSWRRRTLIQGETEASRDAHADCMIAWREGRWLLVSWDVFWSR